MSFNVFTPNSSGHMTSSESLENITGNSPSDCVNKICSFPEKANVLRLPELHCNVSALYFRSADCPKEKQYAVNVYAVFSILSGITAVNHAYLLTPGQFHGDIIEKQCFSCSWKSGKTEIFEPADTEFL